MERGKHVYVQKPLTRTIWEARMLQRGRAKYKVATQMGNQGYSNEGTRQCAEMIWNGDIGNVTEVHAWTNRPIWPQGFTEIPAETPVPPTLDWDLWLGIANSRPYTSGGEGYPAGTRAAISTIPPTGAASTISAAARWATWPATSWGSQPGVQPQQARAYQRGMH